MLDAGAILMTILFIILGLIFGSFISWVSYRLPRGEFFSAKRSACPKCNITLAIRDLFPLFSWIFTKGKCHYCKNKISIRYPLIEIFTASIFGLLYLKYGITINLFFILILVISLITILIIDFEHYIIPDSMQILLAMLGISYGIYHHIAIENMAIGGFIGAAIGTILQYSYKKLKKINGLGTGDVKFFAVAGIWLGIAGFPIFFMLSGMMGIAISLIWRLLGKGDKFPFAPALTIALFIMIIFPEIKNLFDYFINL